MRNKYGKGDNVFFEINCLHKRDTDGLRKILNSNKSKGEILRVNYIFGGSFNKSLVLGTIIYDIKLDNYDDVFAYGVLEYSIVGCCRGLLTEKV